MQSQSVKSIWKNRAVDAVFVAMIAVSVFGFLELYLDR
jgi:hypothetical protein